MKENTVVKLISVWKKVPSLYRLKPSEVMAEVVMKIRGEWHTRHIAIDKTDPLLTNP